MGGSFACPECGHELAPEGLTPGREVHCAECSTWVEVPYLPRVAPPKRATGQRRRKRPAWEWKLLQFAIAFAVVAMVGLVASRMIGSKVRNDRERVLAELVASADRAEAAGKLGETLYQAEAAVAHAREIDREGSNRLDQLIERRDRASLREAEARLAAIDALEPDPAVGEALILADRAKSDRALVPIGEAIDAKVESSRARQAEADLQVASRALAKGDGPGAFAAAERLHDRAGRLASGASRRLKAEAVRVIEAAIDGSGVAMPPVSGRFNVGSPEQYAATFDPRWAEALRDRGFLVQPRGSSWADLWTRRAPFVASCRVDESQDGTYLQSKNRTTKIDANCELTHRGRVVWHVRLLGQTRTLQLDGPAYKAGHLATTDKRDPDVERWFHDDALKMLVEQATRNFRGMPTREVAAKLPQVQP